LIANFPIVVMAGLDPAIHVTLAAPRLEGVDARVKPGHDDYGVGFVHQSLS